MSTKKLMNEKSVMAIIRASRPSFRNSHDKIAFVVHASFLASGYFLNATGTPAFSHDALTSSTTDEVGTDQWNEYAYNYAFVYINPEKGSKKVLVKCLAENGKLIVDAWSGYRSSNFQLETFHLEIDVQHYVKESSGSNYSSHFKNLTVLLNSIYRVILVNMKKGSSNSSSKHQSVESSSSSSTRPSNSSSERCSRDDAFRITNSAKVYILEHRQPCCHLRKSVSAVHPSVSGNLFPELISAGTCRHRNDFGSWPGRRLGQFYPWFFGGIDGLFGGQRIFGKCNCFNKHRQYGTLSFDLNQPSMFWWHWYRVWFLQRKTEVVVELEEEEEEEEEEKIHCSPNLTDGYDST